jgi:hypothetical protein
MNARRLRAYQRRANRLSSLTLAAQAQAFLDETFGTSFEAFNKCIVCGSFMTSPATDTNICSIDCALQQCYNRSIHNSFNTEGGLI